MSSSKGRRPPHALAEDYHEAVEFIKNAPLSLGALVTTHKIDLYNSCKDQFTYIDLYAEQLGEVSSISKEDGLYCAHAKDPISNGLALENFVPDNYWTDFAGDTIETPLTNGQAVYVLRSYAHRTVNTGTKPMVLFYTFAADAGHDYGTIETTDYHKLIVEKDGKPTIVDNPIGNNSHKTSLVVI